MGAGVAQVQERRVKLIKLAMVSALAGAAMCISGCNVAAPIAYLIHGPDKVPAVYTLDPAKTTVVFVDDSNSQLPARSIRSEIATSIEKVLLSQGCLKDVIDHRNAFQKAYEDRTGTNLSVTEIGQGVTAKIVIYVEIEEFGISADGYTFNPFATARVKVMDVDAQKRLFPDAGRGHPVIIRPTPQSSQPPKSVSERLEAARLLGAELGHAIAQLFYEHEARNSAGQGNFERNTGPFNDPR